MRITDRLPESVTVDGRRYRLDLDFRNVLQMLEILANKNILEAAKCYRALRCVMRRVPRNEKRQMQVFSRVMALLFGDNVKKDDPPEPYMSLEQDAELIIGAFRQAYGINLLRDRLHWLEFRVLLGCLPEGSRYAEVVGIRMKPLPKRTKYNGEEIRTLMKAKAEVALRRSDEEIEASYKASVHRVAESLKVLAKRGENH